MKLGLTLGYWMPDPFDPLPLATEAERLGFDSVWTAEAYGSDAITPLAYLAAVTKRIRLGTGIMQLAARPPASAAMAAGTVDALAGGHRVIAGLGVSGPQIVEGWYGQPWGKPYWRVRAIGRGKGCPYQPSTTWGPETPTPRMSRPFVRWSSVVTVIATQAGVRAEICMMPVPSLMRDVCAPTHASGVKASEP